MSYYGTLITAIKQVIKENGNQEITGQILQDILVSMIDDLGAYPTFAGIVYPDEQEVAPTAETETGEKMEIEQDANVFYLAFAEGQYNDFGIELDGMYYHIFRRTQDGWEDVNTYILTAPFMEEVVQAIRESIQQISSNFSNYSTTEEITAAIVEALKPYITKEESTMAITTALQSYMTSGQTTQAISDAIAIALTSYSTTEQMNEAIISAVNNAQLWIENALLNYVTKTALTQALQRYATTEAMTTAIENALESYYTKDETDATLREYAQGFLTEFRRLTTYAGMATFDTTPPDNARTKLFYHANRPGYYPGFDVTLEHQGLYAISNESGSWVATLLVLGEVPSIDYSKEYFHIEALEDDTTISFPIDVEYSNDQTTWTSLPANTNTPTMAKGDKLYFKAAATVLVKTISVSKKFNAAGNIMSLANGDDFIGVETIGSSSIFQELFENSSIVDASNLKLPATTLAAHCYSAMFYGCTSLTQAPDLPATTLADNCYVGMFQGCTSLTQAPDLPATTMAGSCYKNMFQGCTSLTQAPELPATTLASNCYFGMFRGCTSLTQAPELPATTLEGACYSTMFYGCTSLTQAPELPATTLASNCYSTMFYGCTRLVRIVMLATVYSYEGLYEWVSGVAASGTFVKAAGVTIPSGKSGIPNGWTVEERAVA